MKKHSAADYKLMERWHRSTGSNEYFIRWLQQKAAEAGAPIDAIYRRNEDNTWVTIKDLPTNHPFRLGKVRLG